MDDLFERIVLLKQSDIFSEIDTEDLRLVAQVLDVQACFSGEIIFHMNDPCDQMYIIKQGRVGIVTGEEVVEDKVKFTMGPGECFGEMGMFNDSPRSATALVLEDGMLYSLQKAKLHTLIVRHPELAMGLLSTLSIRLRNIGRT